MLFIGQKNFLEKTVVKTNKNNIFQFVSFNIIGLINTLLTTLLFFVLIYLEGNYIISLFIVYVLGILFSFYMNKNFTFKYYSSNTLIVFIRMCSSYIFIFLLNASLLHFFIERISINKYLSQILAMFLLIIISFILQKFFVFKEKI